jgi:hypothetical protein
MVKFQAVVEYLKKYYEAEEVDFNPKKVRLLKNIPISTYLTLNDFKVKPYKTIDEEKTNPTITTSEKSL